MKATGRASSHCRRELRPARSPLCRRPRRSPSSRNRKELRQAGDLYTEDTGGASVQHAAIALMHHRRQQHLRLPAITCDKHCNVYNRRLRRSALYQPTVTSLQTEQLRALSMGAPAFYSHATRKGHTHSPLLATTATGRSINISSQIVFSAISYTLRRPTMKGISSVVYPRSTVLSLRFLRAQKCYLLHTTIYKPTRWPKKVSHKVLSISLLNIDRFLNFFHW